MQLYAPPEGNEQVGREGQGGEGKAGLIQDRTGRREDGLAPAIMVTERGDGDGCMTWPNIQTRML